MFRVGLEAAGARNALSALQDLISAAFDTSVKGGVRRFASFARDADSGMGDLIAAAGDAR